MALASLLGGGGLWIPRPSIGSQGAPSYQANLLDAAAERFSAIFKVPKTGNVSHLHFRTGVVTASTTLDVRLETVDGSTGDPSGTLFGTNTNGSQASLASSTWYRVALTAAAAVTRGDFVALTIANSGSGNLNIVSVNSNFVRAKFPYTDLFAGAGPTWTKSDTAPCCALEYDDGSFAISPGVVPVSNLAGEMIESDTTPDEIALKFRLPGPVRVSGCWLTANYGAAADFDLVLYDSDGTTALRTISLDATNKFGAASGLQTYDFGASQALLANTYYRLALKPSSAVNAVTIDVLTVNSAGLMDCFGGGQDFHYSVRTDAGAWSDTTTKRPFLGLIIDQIDDGTGSGSSGVRFHPGMNGGING